MQILSNKIKKYRENKEITKEYNTRLERELKDLKEKVSTLEILIDENQ